jgi:hypothetical protein
MPCRIVGLTCLALLTLTFPAVPGGPTKEKEKTPPDVPAGVVLRFHNGSVVQPAVLMDSLEMETKLGKLSIPANEIRQITFGFRLSEEDTKRLDQAIRDLGSTRFQARDAATKTLMKMGRLAYPALMEARKNGDLETTKRVEAILKDIRARVPPERLKTRKTDIVKTSDSTLGGTILAPSLRVRSDLFGEVKVPTHQLRELRSTLPGGEMLILVDSSKYGQQTTWMESDYEVTMGSKLDITASGEINVDPMNRINNQFCRGIKPDGTPNLTSGEPFGYQPGKLLAKIGPDGPVIQVGSRYSGFANREGKLYFRIVTIFHANSLQAEGNYTIRVSTEQ